jgi:hypothetical protein
LYIPPRELMISHRKVFFHYSYRSSWSYFKFDFVYSLASFQYRLFMYFL